MTIETKYNIGDEVWWYWLGSCVTASGKVMGYRKAKDKIIRHYIYDIQITETFIPDSRLPKVWKGGSYNVIGKFQGCDGYAVIGQCNFRK